MGGTPFTLIPYLTSIAVGYKNKNLIADDVLPRVMVGSPLFQYTKYNLGDQFTIPDTKVARTSAPGQVEFTGNVVTDSTEDHALDAPIPNSDTEAAKAANIPGYDPEARAAENVSAIIALDREVRAAGLAFNPANFGASNKVTLTNPWSDKTLGDPLTDLQSALDASLNRYNILVLGQKAATALSRHPTIVEAFYGNSATSGIVPLSFLAGLLQLDAVYIGQAYSNTAKPGQTLVNARVWDPTKALLLYRDSVPSADSGTSFGLTAQWGQKISGRLIDPDMGMRGGIRVRVGESVKELITANDLGYLFSNASA